MQSAIVQTRRIVCGFELARKEKYITKSRRVNRRFCAAGSRCHAVGVRKQRKACVLGAARNAEIRYTPSGTILRFQNVVFIKGSLEKKLRIILLGACEDRESHRQGDAPCRERLRKTIGLD